MPENWKLANAAITDMQMRQRDVAALDAKYGLELADAKAENDALRDDVAAGRRSIAYQQSVSQCVKPPRPPAWIMQPPPDWQIPLNGIIFTLRERLITMQKQLKKTRSILMIVDRVAHTDGQLMQLLWAIHTRFQREYNALKYKKTEQSIYECLLGFCFNNIFCAATNFGCIDSFLLPNSRNEEMMGDGFGATAAGLFWTVNVCWAHPVIRNSAVASSIFLKCVIPDAFEVRRIVCVEN